MQQQAAQASGAAVAGQATAPVPAIAGTPGATPNAVYQALRDKREVLSDQMNRLLNRRDNIREQLQQVPVGTEERAVLEQHLREVNTRILDMEKVLHTADAEVAAAAGVPGATMPIRRERGGSGNNDAAEIGAGLFGIALIILSIAWARRLWRGATNVIARLPAGFEERFARMEEAMDAVSIEVERISEGQRFLSRLFAEQGARAIGTGPAQPIETHAEVKETVPRG